MGTSHDKYVSLPRCKQGLRCSRWHFKMFRTIKWPLPLYCHIKHLGMRPAYQTSLIITPLYILPLLCFSIIQGIYLEAFYRPPTKLQEGNVSSQFCLSFYLVVPNVTISPWCIGPHQMGQHPIPVWPWLPSVQGPSHPGLSTIDIRWSTQETSLFKLVHLRSPLMLTYSGFCTMGEQAVRILLGCFLDVFVFKENNYIYGETIHFC